MYVRCTYQHCCTPNCTAKILTVNGEKRIGIFAKQQILPGQELTYDYKCASAADQSKQLQVMKMQSLVYVARQHVAASYS